MKIQKAFVLLLFGTSLMFFCSCAINTGTKFGMPDVDKLQLGRTQIADAVILFGKPDSHEIDVKPDGNYEFYKYHNTKIRFLSTRERLLLLEFKDGKLNGYCSWSSFAEDKFKLDLKNIDELKAGIGKLTKDDVLHLVGKPNWKALCPSMISEFKEDCAKNTEIWEWYSVNHTSSLGVIDKWSRLYICFDGVGKISSLKADGSKGYLDK